MSTPGKGGKHAFLTLRADFLAGNPSDLNDYRGSSQLAGTCLTESPVDGRQHQQQLSDWLGEFLPARATDTDQLRGERRRKERQEASTFLAYLRHQRDWLRAIERARAPRSLGKNGSSGSHEMEVSGIVDSVLIDVEQAIRKSGECPEEWRSVRDSLVTARRWRRSARSVQGENPEAIP